MKKLLIFLLMIFMLSIAGIAGATTYTFQPDDPDLWDLDHHYYYTWGTTDAELIEALSFNSNSVITDITIEFDNIYNWSDEDSRLFVWLLDGLDVYEDGIAQYSDDGGSDVSGAVIDDAFDSDGFTGINLVTYETPDSNDDPLDDIPYGSSNAVDIAYSFTPDEILLFTEYLTNGDTIGLGFDPDCHYFNEGISIKITVPEPTPMLLLGTGLIGLAGIGRRRFLK